MSAVVVRQRNQAISRSVWLSHTFLHSMVTADCQIDGDRGVARQLERQGYRVEVASFRDELFEMFVKTVKGLKIFRDF